MIKNILTTVLCIVSLMGCAQNKKDNSMNDIELIPYLTKDGTFNYVDKNLKTQIQDKYFRADVFTNTGYALVANSENKIAIINQKGKIIEPYTEANVEYKVANGLTFLLKETEYVKKLAIWNWDWNIMGGDIEKTENYVHVEIKILETGQILTNAKIPEDENRFSLYISTIDETHFVLNNVLYEVTKNKVNIVKKDIEKVFGDGRYIPSSEGKFEIWNAKNNQRLHENLEGTTTITVNIGNEIVTLENVNGSKYSGGFPNNLKNSVNGDIYTYPEFDKVFPKEILIKTDEQLATLKEMYMLYSVTNTPYFILSRFNHDIHQYEWMYLDDKGNILTEIEAENFIITDRIGNIQWPEKSMIIPSKFIDSNWKIEKIKYRIDVTDLYKISLKNKKNKELKFGIWNRKTQSWEIDPTYNELYFLNNELQIMTLQAEKNGNFILYNNKTKKQIGQKSYKSIETNGLVEDLDGKIYFIDLVTGKEYKED